MLPSPARSAGLADDSHRIQALPKCCAPCSGESRLPDNVPAPAFVARTTPSLSLLQTSPLRSREVASSNRRTANHESRGHDRMPPSFARLRAVPKIALATSPTAPCGFASSHQCAAQTTAQQDEVYRALTNSPIKIARTWIFTRCCRVGTRESRRRRCLREYSTGPGLR